MPQILFVIFLLKSIRAAQKNNLNQYIPVQADGQQMQSNQGANAPPAISAMALQKPAFSDKVLTAA
ncbi:hypothetical protein [Marinospirillum alkaliphilum]|uniref:Uncharacterized protein n=1 Tax=Marinospirillum alkaliphilum DSM 21637 TaxID=1122209 RepID=A0A1K1YQZ8_9GAMM|nr:hypothetical protein [Marinospirillum alkaliphilum]SFX63749.1 hypothetical protein SAMN02745752_02354 [Marinospirillum alkaliphilum DSM 21637]